MVIYNHRTGCDLPQGVKPKENIMEYEKVIGKDKVTFIPN